MQKIFTKGFMIESKGCYSDERLSACSFMRKEAITLADILNSEIPLKDKYWFVCNALLSPAQNTAIAILCAEAVLPIYEAAYPGDDTLRKAAELAKKGDVDAADAYAAVRAAHAAAYVVGEKIDFLQILKQFCDEN